MIRISLLLVVLCAAIPCGTSAADVFPDMESKEAFAKDISEIIKGAWKKWQDTVLIDGIEVEGSHGFLTPGDMGGAFLGSSDMLKFFDKKGKTHDNITCVKTVIKAVEKGMRSWQRGYSHKEMLFPQGASCTYTLPPCNNVPVTIDTGSSLGDKDMTEEALYGYMRHLLPTQEEDIVVVLHISARAISECFNRWKRSCSIVGVMAKGGIAPSPSPMGQGPGPVRGAKGNGGKLVGAYFDSNLMYREMLTYFKETEKGG